MGKMTLEPEQEITSEGPITEPLYVLVAREAGVPPTVARSVLVALRKLGFTIATPRVQWR